MLHAWLKSDDDFGEFRVVFGILQIFGLAPYVIGRDVQHSRRSRFMVFYNLVIIALLYCNMYIAEKDSRNYSEYPNKTFLLDIAYDIVDILGNIYVGFGVLKATIHTDVGIVVWFKMRDINVKLKELNIQFDYKKMRCYVIFKVLLLSLAAFAFFTTDVYLHDLMNVYFTPNYWFVSCFPTLFSVVVGIVFGSCTLCLFQRFWVVNQFLKRFVDEYDELKNKDETKGLKNTIYNERLLEEIALEGYKNIPKRNKICPEKMKKEKSLPTLLMIKNYPFCFDRKKHSLLNDVRLLRDVHFKLYDLTNNLNTLFGTHFFFIFVTYFFGCTINLYFAITFHLRAFQREQYASACLWAIVYVFLIIYLITYSNIASHEANRTKEYVHMFLSKVDFNEVQLQTELQSFASQLLQCPIQFTACGFFTLDSPLLFQFVSGVMSNLVFVIQFDKINFS